MLPSIGKPNKNTVAGFDSNKSRGSSRRDASGGIPGYPSTNISSEISSNIAKNTRMPNHGGADVNKSVKRVNLWLLNEK